MMRTLFRQANSRIAIRSLWVYQRCLKCQSTPYSTSIGAVPLAGDDEPGAAFRQLPIESTNSGNSSEAGTKIRTHQKNRGKYFVTTPIFYVNGDPHIGHMHSMILADVAKRYKDLWRKSTLLSTGTDEHGMKVQKAASSASEDPLKFCTKASQKFRDLVEKVDMNDHVFIRTTQPEHKAAVQHFWKILQDNGHIYKGRHEGWYSITDECFYKDSQVEDRQDPSGTLTKVSKDTGSTVEWTSEENYCFRLSGFQERLKEHYMRYPKAIIPSNYYLDVLNTLAEPLEDISISRPRNRLSWGIEVPGDPDQTIYVWFDALVNYLTVTGYPWKMETTEELMTESSDEPATFDEAGLHREADKAQGMMSKEHEDLISEPNISANLFKAWPADLHIIGKDIVRFHCIFWPSFLMAAGISLPRQILVHAHWRLNGFKMSKSLGNVVTPSELFKSYHPDIIRYYLVKEGGLSKDGNWSDEALQSQYLFLLNNWGNLIARITSSKMDLEKAVHNVWRNGEYCGIDSADPEEDRDLRNAIESAVDIYRYEMNLLQFSKALTVLSRLWRRGNQYVTRIEPWNYRPGLQFDSVQYQVGEVARIGALFAQPFMPAKAAEMLDTLGVAPTRRSLRFALWGSDRSYGKRDPSRAGHVFPKLKMEGPGNGESMVELMQRKRAEKLALKEEQRQESTRRTTQAERLQMGV